MVTCSGLGINFASPFWLGIPKLSACLSFCIGSFGWVTSADSIISAPSSLSSGFILLFAPEGSWALNVLTSVDLFTWGCSNDVYVSPLVL